MVFLIRTDINNGEKINIDEGSNILGRAVIGCDDQRISRTHCELIVNRDELKLKALDSNQCFVKTSKISHTIIVSKGQDRILQRGDTFGLLPNDFWYKILITGDNLQMDTQKVEDSLKNSVYYDSSDSDKNEEPISNTVRTEEPNYVKSEPSEANAANVEASDEELPAKRQRMNDSTSDVKPDVDSLNAAIAESSSSTASDSGTANAAPDNSGTVRAEANDSGTVGAEPDVSGTVKTEPDDTKPVTVKQESNSPDSTTPTVPAPAPAPAPSNGPVVRERCMYADRCYRKNVEHRRMFSHPGDTDYQQGANLPCPFGAQCRRRDPRHWQNQTHPSGAKPRRKKRDPVKAASQDQLKRADRKARKVVKKRPSWSGSESENDYDSEDSWLTDDSECWSPDGTSSMSDE